MGLDAPSAPAGDGDPDPARCPPLGRRAAWRALRDLLAQAAGCYSDGPPARADLTPARRLDTSDLGVDSLSRLQLGQQVADLFDLRHGGRADLLLARRRVGDWAELAADGWAEGPERVTFQTSGSQGTPQRVAHTAAHLWAEAGVLARHLPDRRRVVSLVPAHHIYGFIWTILLPRALDIPVLDLTEAGPQALGRTLAPGDLIVGVPPQWDFAASALSPGPDDVVAASSTGPLAAETARALVRDAGFARVVEAFGASETGGIGLRDDPEAPFELLEIWDLDTDAEGTTTLHRRRDGRLIAPPDHLAPLDARRFRPAGRRDRAVTIGGRTVSCADVARRLERRPGVAAARVRPADGRLKALIVPHPDQDGSALHAEIRAWCDSQLPAAERPLRIAIARRVPTDALGKELDWEEPGTRAGSDR